MKIFYPNDVHSNEIKVSLSHLLFIPKSMNSANLTAGNCTWIIFVNLCFNECLYCTFNRWYDSKYGEQFN